MILDVKYQQKKAVWQGDFVVTPVLKILIYALANCGSRTSQA